MARKNAKKVGAKEKEASIPPPLLGRTTMGKVFVCGQGDLGQLGLGENVMERKRFTHVSTLPSNIVDVCAGGMHTVALDADGCLWTFGCNDEGALGRDTSGENPAEPEGKPARVALPGRAVSVSAGDSHTAALLHTGQVYAWGSFRDLHGSMGLSPRGNEPLPVEMLPGHRAVQVASGADHLVVLTDKGTVFTCGCAEQGQLGRLSERMGHRHSRAGLRALLLPAPAPLSRPREAAEAIWACFHSTFARAVSGRTCVWGLNNFHQMGISQGETIYHPTVSDTCGSSWSKICGGQHHTLLLDRSGICHSLGRCDYGRLGLGSDAKDEGSPNAVPALSNRKCLEIACGTANSFAVTEEGDLYAWGMGSEGQLGSGEEEDESAPRLIKLKEPGHVINVSAGGQHTVILVKENIPAEKEPETMQEETTEPTVSVPIPIEVPVEESAETEPQPVLNGATEMSVDEEVGNGIEEQAQQKKALKRVNSVTDKDKVPSKRKK